MRDSAALPTIMVAAMEELFDQVDAAAAGGLYYLALAGALILPDICSAMDAPDRRASGSRYKAWFSSHVLPRGYEGMFTAEDCYGFRCSLLHQGSTQAHQGSYDRILFVEPSVTGLMMHCNVMEKDGLTWLNLDVRAFVADIVSAAREWLAQARGSATFEHNYQRFLQRYGGGLPPFIVGAPVIS